MTPTPTPAPAMGDAVQSNERRKRAISVAQFYAKKRPESYYAEPFIPHEWVIDAIEHVLKNLDLFTGINHDHITVMQAAWIEWQHGRGPEAAMEWIENTIDGPGLIPHESEPYGREAQAWMSVNRSNPFPTCPCGRPSHILWMGKGFCCDEHYCAAKVKPTGLADHLRDAHP